MKEVSRVSGSILVLGLLVLFQKITQMRLDFFTLALLAAVTGGWASYQLRHTGARLFQGLLLLLAVLLVLGIYAPLPLPVSSSGNWIVAVWQVQWHLMGNNTLIGFFQEVYAYVTDPEKTDFKQWQYLATAGFLLLSEGLVHLHRLKRPEWVYLLAALGCGLLWFAYLDVWFAFAIFFMAYGTQRFTEQGKGTFFGMTLPVVITLLAVLLTSFTPVDLINDKTSQWRNVSDWLRTTAGFSTRGSDFELEALGFYPLKDRLGGPVKLSKEILFKVQAKQGGLYLRGRVLNHYEDNSWREEGVKNTNFKPVKPLAGEKITYTIYNFKEPLSTVLAPLSVSETNLPSKRLSQSSDQIIDYRGDLRQDYNSGVTVIGYDYAQVNLSNREAYLQLPPRYAPEVVQLTKRIVGGATSDKEKLDRIQRYLLEHYQYQLAVSVPPKEQDFVAYFLTQSDSGYCVYFASAATLMARISGIPSRYVEGFVTPLETFENRDTPVSGERAHAWAEVYYNQAWHILETTPTFIELPKEAGKNLDEETLNTPMPQSKRTDPSEDDMPLTTPPSTDEDALYKGFLSLPMALVGLMILLVVYLSQKIRSFLNWDYEKRQKHYASLLLHGLCERYVIIEAEKLSVREIFAIALECGPKAELGGLVEIVEKSLYDSNGCSKDACDILEKAYWALYHKDFSTAMKLKWAYKIARKGRIFYGVNGKNSTA